MPVTLESTLQHHINEPLPTINLQTASRQDLIDHIDKITRRYQNLESLLQKSTTNNNTSTPKSISSASATAVKPLEPEKPTLSRKDTAPIVTNDINSIIKDVQRLNEVKRNLALKFPFFQELSLTLDQQRELVTGLELVRYIRADNIIKRDEEAKEMFFIWNGTVNVMTDAGEVVSSLGENCFFGELGLMFDVKRTATIQVASETCILFKLERASLQRYLQKYPQIQKKFEKLSQDRSDWFQKLMYKVIDGGQHFGGEFVSVIGAKDLAKLSLFQTAESDFLHELSMRLKPERVEDGQTIIKIGDDAKDMYLILSGSVQICGIEEREIYATISAGSFFGEVGLLFKTKRTANVRAVGKGVLLRLSKESLDLVLERYEKVGADIRNAANERFQLFQKRTTSMPSSVQAEMNDLVFEVNQQNLSKVGMFARCERAILDSIASCMTKRTHKTGEIIIKHNSHADEMFFLVHGQVKISSEFGEKIAEEREGTYFGEVGILNNIPRIASVTAKTDCVTYVLTRKSLIETLDKYPEVMAEVRQESEARLQNYLMRSILA